jgi:hypothetical protein
MGLGWVTISGEFLGIFGDRSTKISLKNRF